MSFVRNCITKFLLGVSAVAWTACGEDSGTSAEDSKSTSFTRNTFLNADSLTKLGGTELRNSVRPI